MTATAKTAAKTTTTTRGRGRPRKFEDKFAIVDALKAVRDDAATQPRRRMKMQLVDKGLLETAKVKKTEGRGAPKVVYNLTNKGKAYINLSKSWKRV